MSMTSEPRNRNKPNARSMGEGSLAKVNAGRLTRSVEDIESAESRLRELFETADQGMMLVEVLLDSSGAARDFRYLECNRAASRLLALSNAIGKTLLQVRPDVAPLLLPQLAAVVGSGKPLRFEIRHPTLEDRWFHIQAALVATGSSPHLALLFDEITERKNRERSLAFLAEVSARLVQLTNIDQTMNVLGESIVAHYRTALCSFAVIDDTSSTLAISSAWHQPGAKEVLGEHRMSDYFTEDFAEQCRNGETYVVRDTFHDERAHAAGMRRVGVAALISVPIVSEGRWLFNLGIADSQPRDWREDEIELLRELTARIWTRLERERAEQALVVSEEKYRSLFDSMDEGYCIIEVLFDEAGKPCNWRFEEVNAAFEKNNGLANATGKTILELAPEIEPKWFAIYGRVAETGEPLRFEEHSAALNRWFNLYAFRVGAPNERRIAVLFTDVTEREYSLARLRQSEERLRLAQVAGYIGTTDYDVDADRMICSPEFYSIYGLQPGTDVTLDTLLGVIHPDDLESVEAALRAAILDGAPFADEFRIVRADDGQQRWISKRALSIKVQGRSRRLIGTNIDVSERRRAEELARAGEARVRAMFNQAAAGVFETDAEMRLVMVNKRWCDMLGYPEADMLGRDLLDFVDADERAELARRIAIGGDREFEADICFHRSGGNSMFAATAVSTLIGIGDVRRGLVGVALDVTERNRMESALLASEERLQQALEAGSMGAFVWYPELDRIVDNGILELLDLPVDSPLKMQDVLHNEIHEDDEARCAAALQRACDPAGDGLLKEIVRFRYRDGSFRWLVASGRVRFDGDPPHAWYLSGVLVDITAEKNAEAELRELNETLEQRIVARTHELAESERRVRQTASKLARAEQVERRRISQVLHDDLQQQLHGMQMKLGMVRRQIGNGDVEGAKHGIDEVVSWAGEGVHIARQLTTDLSPPIMKSEGLIETLEWLVGEMCDKHELAVEVIGERGIVMRDDDLRVLLFQIVRELLFNIVKHAETDQASVEVESGDAGLLVRVRDAGCGFAADSGVKPKKDGGFGLFSVRERLALFGASMEIDSTPGTGTCVTIAVPPDAESNPAEC